MDLPSSLFRDISPPRASKRKASSNTLETPHCCDAKNDPMLAAVEAGKARIENHLTYFKHHLAKALRSTSPDVSKLSINNFTGLYKSNQHEHGRHFVVHQYNHPKAGVHHDRLQFSVTSSVSWAFPKGLPGNPNSRQLGRMAIETRVHNLWNNLIESAAMKTGSLLICDTGTYSVLPNKTDKQKISSPQTADDNSDSDSEETGRFGDSRQESEKLVEAFKSRHIRLRLDGTRLPKKYTITLRLPSNNNIHQRPSVRRISSKPIVRGRQSSHDSDSENTSITAGDTPEFASIDQKEVEADDLDTDSGEDALTRSRNPYPESTNNIGSVHQRRWFVLLDRQSSGFESKGGKWTRRTIPNG